MTTCPEPADFLIRERRECNAPSELVCSVGEDHPRVRHRGLTHDAVTGVSDWRSQGPRISLSRATRPSAATEQLRQSANTHRALMAHRRALPGDPSLDDPSIEFLDPSRLVEGSDSARRQNSSDRPADRPGSDLSDVCGAVCVTRQIDGDVHRSRVPRMLNNTQGLAAAPASRWERDVLLVAVAQRRDRKGRRRTGTYAMGHTHRVRPRLS
jgi:hypothetical protein